MPRVEYTKIEQAIMTILSDGLPHWKKDLHKECMGPSSLDSLKAHIKRIREKIRPHGQDLICELVNRRICYRHVRLIASANNGRK